MRAFFVEQALVDLLVVDDQVRNDRRPRSIEMHFGERSQETCMRDAFQPISLEEASKAASQGNWPLILRLPPSCSEHDIHRARRELQRSAHQDRGGCPELSTLINMAADNALAVRDPACRWRRKQQDCEDELRRRREDARQYREQQRLQQEEEFCRRAEQRNKRLLEKERIERNRAHKDTVRQVGWRRTRCKGPAYLGELAGKAFPVIKRRMQKLQQTGKQTAAQALAFAVESEIIARRIARESSFPKTEHLATRDSSKAMRLCKLQPLYQKAYDRLRYVRRAGLPDHFARLCVNRLLHQAWAVMLEMPTPYAEQSVIVMEDCHSLSQPQ